jgi:amidohydrolase
MASTADLERQLRAALAAELPAAVPLRHELHARPELSWQEEPTAARVAAALGAPDAPAVAGAGRAIRIGPATGSAVVVRAELDALPIHERTGAPFAAGNGRMHACGHDVHLAALAALGRAARRVELPVALLAVLQPSEETTPSGAKALIDSGIFERHRVAAFVAGHVHPAVPAGAVTAGGGPVNAANDHFEIVVTGRGGHGGHPHLTDDPVPVLAQIVTALQQLVGRRIDPMHPAVVTVGMLQAGSAPNVVPDTARALGILRSLAPGDRETLRSRLVQVAEHTAAALGCTAEVTIRAGEPVLVNDERLAAAAEAWLARAGVPVPEPPRSCGADDFAFYGRVAPSLMLFVGADAGTGAGLHTATFLPSDDSVGVLAEALLAGYLGAVDASPGVA